MKVISHKSRISSVNLMKLAAYAVALSVASVATMKVAHADWKNKVEDGIPYTFSPPAMQSPNSRFQFSALMVMCGSNHYSINVFFTAKPGQNVITTQKPIDADMAFDGKHRQVRMYPAKPGDIGQLSAYVFDDSAAMLQKIAQSNEAILTVGVKGGSESFRYSLKGSSRAIAKAFSKCPQYESEDSEDVEFVPLSEM
jgi:hypothetical protein